MTDATARIRALNDLLRMHGTGGGLLVTSGVSDLGPLAVAGIVARMREAATFDERNDPYGEHDFGSLTWGGQTVFWKIDYYDPSLSGGSEDPADPTVTARVLTIMLATEY